MNDQLAVIIGFFATMIVIVIVFRLFQYLEYRTTCWRIVEETKARCASQYLDEPEDDDGLTNEELEAVESISVPIRPRHPDAE